MSLPVRVIVWVTLAILASVATVIAVQMHFIGPEIQHSRMATIRGFGATLASLPEAQQAMRAQELEEAFGYPVRILDTRKMSAEVQRQAKGGVPFTIGPLDKTTAYFPQEQARIVKVGPLPFGKPPFVRLSLLTIVVGLLAGFAVTWKLVAPIVRGLLELERVSKQIRHGDLSARAEPLQAAGIFEVADAFNRMAEHNQSMIKKQKHLLQAVSHEFRTPAARLRFDLDLLGTAKSAEDRTMRYERIEDSLDELDDLLSELLEYMRFSEHSLELPTETICVLKELERVEALSPRPDRISLVVECEGDTTLVASPRHFRRIVSNLVQNAIRHANTRVLISASEKNAEFMLRVEDDGQGISEQDRERIFEPFVRLDESRERELGGAGLGLAMVKQIVQWHGGSVSVEASSLGGALFIARFPA